MPTRAVIGRGSDTVHFQLRLRLRDRRQNKSDRDQRQSHEQMCDKRLHGMASTSASEGQFPRLSEVRLSCRYREASREQLRGAWRPGGPSRQTKTPPPERRRRFVFVTLKRNFLVLGRLGSDLLSQGLSHSTIGAE